MRKRFKIPIGVLLFFFLAVAVTLFIITKTSFLERRVNELLALALEQKYDVKIRLGEIGGSILSGFYVTDIIVEYPTGDSARQIASIQYLDIDYDLRDLFARNWRIKSIVIDSLQVSVRERDDGSLAVPEFGSGGGNGSSIFEFTVDRIFVVNSQVEYRRNSGESDNVDQISLVGNISKAGNRMQIDIDTLSLIHRESGLRLRHLAGSTIKTDNLLSIENVRLITDSSDISLEAEVTLGDSLQISGIIDSSIVSVSEISRLTDTRLNGLLEVWGGAEYSEGVLEADLTVNGIFQNWDFRDLDLAAEYSNSRVTFTSVRGTAFGGRIHGSAGIDLGKKPEEFYFGGNVSSFDVSQATSSDLRTSLSGYVDLTGRGTRSEDIVIDLVAELSDGTIDEYSFDSLSGRCRVTPDSIVFAYPVDFQYKSTSVGFGGKIEYSGSIDIEGEAGLADIEDFDMQTFLGDIGGQGTASFAMYGPANDPAVTGSFSSDSVWVRDYYSRDFYALIDISRAFTEPSGDIEFYSGTCSYSGLEFASAHSSLTLAGDTILIDRTEISAPPFDLAAAGILEIGEDSLRLSLVDAFISVDSELVRNAGEIDVIFTDSGLQIVNAPLETESERLEISGTYHYDGSFDIGLSIDSARLSTWLTRFYDDLPIDGRLSAEGEVAGNLESPGFGFDIRIDSVLATDQHLGQLTGHLSYGDKTLSLTDVSLIGAGNESTLHGFIPLDLAFEKKETRIVRTESARLFLSSSGTNFDLIEALFEDVEWVTGDYSAEVTATGAIDSLDLNGSIRVTGGQCKLYYVEDPLSDLNFTGSLDGSVLTVANLSGELNRKGDKGSFSSSGTIDLSSLNRPEFDLRITGSNLPVKYDVGDIEMLVDHLELGVTGTDPPNVAGRIDLSRFTYREPFYEGVEAEALEAADTTNSIDYNITLSIPQNMWIKNDEADVELGGELVILDEGMNRNFLGELETIRGRFTLVNLSRTFNIRPGGTIVFDNIQDFDPKLNIEMTTTIRDSSGIRDICLQLTRTLRDPNIDVCPGSDLAIDEALVFLNPIGGSFGGSMPGDTLESGSGWQNRVTYGAAGMALNRVSRLVSRELGVETFEINPTSGSRSLNPLESELTVGFYTSPRLYIYGTSQLTFGKAQELGFDYRLSDHVFISGQRDRSNLYHFNLNLSWEFE